MARAAVTAALLAACLALAAGAQTGRPQTRGPFGIGADAPPDLVRQWDLDIGPDGTGLPPGHGTAHDGERVYAGACAACHGPRIGLAPERWFYASTLFDYIRRAMPADHPRSLGPNDLYAVSAFVLWSNGLLEPNAVLDRNSLPHVRFPSVDRLITTPRP